MGTRSRAGRRHGGGIIGGGDRVTVAPVYGGVGEGGDGRSGSGGGALRVEENAKEARKGIVLLVYCVAGPLLYLSSRGSKRTFGSRESVLASYLVSKRT